MSSPALTASEERGRRHLMKGVAMPSPSERQLRARLQALAYALLAELDGQLTGPITLSVADELANVSLILTPAGAARGSQDRLSSLEKEIVQTLQVAPLVGKAIAARLHRPYDGTLKTILANLVDRGILTSSTLGYDLSDRGTT